uniref:Uncharacterized protein n=1 Tax=Arundo donax TaxID=35708 RepID=A0A0A8YVB9_ARUDO
MQRSQFVSQRLARRRYPS